MNRTTRRLVATTAGLVTAALALLTSPAHAYPYADSGSGTFIGRASTTTGSCKYMRTNVNGWMRTATSPPVVTGANPTYGAGNDWSWVRYRAFLVRLDTGATVTSTGWSGWLSVRDDQSATWSGTTLLDGTDWRGNYVVDYRIEWWNSTRILGWQAHRLTPYVYYDGISSGSYGPISSCYKYH